MDTLGKGINNNAMLKIYASKQEEIRLLQVLAEFKCRAYLSYPIKGRTRKVRKSQFYKVTNFPS